MSAAGSQWERVPAELKQQPRWVCWRLVERDGRKTKMPLCAATGKMASSTDASTWCSFDAAVSAVERLGASGVGFVFGPDRAYTGLDLDHVMRDGFLSAEYRWVVEESDTYCEVSPSGDGLHLFFRGPKPQGAERCRKGPVEMYDHDRYFTVTGNSFGAPRPIQERPDVVERAYRTWIEPEAGVSSGQAPLGAAGKGAVAKTPPAGDGPGTPDMSDEALVDRMLASARGAEIGSLMGGDLAAHGGDHSAADMALCNHLAFWCAGDEARMDRIFRSSGLMRDKWDSRRGSETYGAQTVRRAARGATEFYRPRRGGGRGADGGIRYRRGDLASKYTDKCSTAKAAALAAPEKAVAEGGPQAPTGDVAAPPSLPGWSVDGEGNLFACAADGRVRYHVTSTPPWVACDLVDVDTGDVRALVRLVDTDGNLVERTIDRDVLMNQGKVIGALGPMGACVSTDNAKDLVRYLTDCERRLGRRRPRRRSVTHLGWADRPLGEFMPYAGAGGNMRFNPTGDGAVKARPFLEPKGTLEGWVAGVSPARDASMAFRCVLAASFASPLVSVVDVQTFIVYLWGRSRSGKTPTLKAAGSVWGDPSEGVEGYFRTFADTPKSIVRAATLLHDIPILIDELQSKGSAGGGQAGKRMAVEDLLYSLSIGHERGALNSDRSMMRTGSWRSLTIATGEIPIVGDSTQQGAANRTLELNAEPFGDTEAAKGMHRLVKEQHGTAGRAFVESLRRNPRGFYDEGFSAMLGAVGEIAGGHPQADNAALLAFADALAEYYVFRPGRDWDECFAGGVELARWALGNATGREAADTDLKAIQFVSEWLLRNAIHFDESCEMDRLERYGVLEERASAPERRTWCVFSSVLERALADAGFDRAKTLRRMADEGLLELPPTAKGFTCQRRIKGSRVYCVCVDGAALAALLERGPTAGVLTGAGDSPC